MSQSRSKLGDNYCLEEDQTLLELLTNNAEPILSDLLSQIQNFNSYAMVGGQSPLLLSSDFGDQFSDEVELLTSKKHLLQIIKDSDPCVQKFDRF